MDHRNEEPHEEKNIVDRELDAALAKYAAVEPRAGLDERILASLQAERERVPAISWWRWSAVVAAVAVVAVAMVWRWSRPSGPVVKTHPSVSSPPTRLASNGAGREVRRAEPQAVRRAKTHGHGAQVAIAPQPKLDQFPSPKPLSEQERILQSYVAQFPDHAVLIARARTEELRRDAIEEMKLFPSGKGAADSEGRNQDTTDR